MQGGGTSERRGIDRIGTLSAVVPRRNYCKFEDWLAPFLGRMRRMSEVDSYNSLGAGLFLVDRGGGNDGAHELKPEIGDR